MSYLFNTLGLGLQHQTKRRSLSYLHIFRYYFKISTTAMEYRGIVFDFDGVIVDSEEYWKKIEGAYLKKNIPDWDDRNYSMLIGKSLKDAHTLLKRSFGFSQDYETYASDYGKMATLIYSRNSTIAAGAKKLFQVLSTRDVKLAIASSSRPDWIKMALDRWEVSKFFPVIVSVDDNKSIKGKPAPDVYLQAAKALGETPAKLIAVEDSFNGSSAAKSAGFFCIGFRNGDNDDQDLSRADAVIEGFTPKSIRFIEELLA